VTIILAPAIEKLIEKYDELQGRVGKLELSMATISELRSDSEKANLDFENIIFSEALTLMKIGFKLSKKYWKMSYEDILKRDLKIVE